jgi:drug/metabolite transporter (DMT)-like permease
VAVLCGAWVGGDLFGSLATPHAVQLYTDTGIGIGIDTVTGIGIDTVTGIGAGIGSMGGMGSMGSLESLGTVQRLLAPLRDPGPLIYLGLVTTALCNYLQTLGQRVVPAERAAVIYSADPVYGAFFSWLVLGERLGPQGFLGAGLILLGIYVSNRGGVTGGGGEKSSDIDSGVPVGAVGAVGAGTVGVIEAEAVATER